MKILLLIAVMGLSTTIVGCSDDDAPPDGAQASDLSAPLDAGTDSASVEGGNG